jgi:PhzF family phenazine biosynthesis protein
MWVMRGILRRYTAFTTVPTGGNPAGVWIGDALPPLREMQRIAAEVGYSETAFIAPARGLVRTVRYYSPEQEIEFCGHATIASGVVLGETEGAGTYRFSIKPGEIPVRPRLRSAGICAMQD